jgi:hypothetical protein
MKILVQPSGPDRRVPWPPQVRNAPRYFPQGAPQSVELDDYIQRRLADGDLVEVKPDAAVAVAPTTAPAAKAAPAAAPAAPAAKVEG